MAELMPAGQAAAEAALRPRMTLHDQTQRTQVLEMRGHDEPHLDDLTRFVAAARMQGLASAAAVTLRLYPNDDTWTLSASYTSTVHPPTEATP